MSPALLAASAPRPPGWPHRTATVWCWLPVTRRVWRPSLNRSAGSQIKNAIDKKVGGFIEATQGKLGGKPAKIKRDYNLTFDKAYVGFSPP